MKNRLIVISALTGMLFLLSGLLQNAGAGDQAAAVPKKFRSQLSGVVESYLEVKDALSRSDFKAASEAADGLEKSLNELDEKLLPEASRPDLTDKIDILQQKTVGIKNASDLNTQREAFLVLSEQLGLLGKQYGPLSLTLYRQYCPMAFGEGGQWLSDSREIKNPYYGTNMQKCGEVVETIEGDDK